MAVCAAPSAFGDFGRFGDLVSIGLPSAGWSADLADMNADGKLDAVVGTIDGTLLIYPGRGDGSFDAPASYRFSSSYGFQSPNPQIFDYNGDSKLDVVVSDRVEDQIRLFLGNGDGTLQAPHTIVIVGVDLLGDMVAGDWNRDGKTDLAMSDDNRRAVCLLFGDGTTFGNSVLHEFTSYPANFAVADFNNDGNDDLAFKFESSSGTTFRTFTDFGTLAGTVGNLPSNYYFDSRAGDLAGNGNASMVYAVDRQILLIANLNGNSTLQGYWIGDTPHSVRFADMDGDGKLDVVTGNLGSVSVLFGNGDTTLQQPQTFGYGIHTPYEFDIGDLNGDGRPDLVLADFTGNLRILLQTKLEITSVAAATFEAGIPNSFTFIANSNPAASFSATGALPAGVTLSSNGVLSGTPVPGSEGSYPLAVTASNGLEPDVTQNFTLTVEPSRVPVITSPSLAGVTAHTAQMGASIGNDWGLPITRRGFVYSLTDVTGNPKLGGGGVTVVDDPNPSIGGFNTTVLDLVPSARYSFAAFAENARGVAHTQVVHFQTLALPGSGSLVVTTATDEDNGTSDPNVGTGTSLREAVAYANALGGAQTITFSPNLFISGPATLSLPLGQLFYDSPAGQLTITGPGADQLTLDGGGTTRIFWQNSGSLTISGIAFSGGRASSSGSGGAIRSAGLLRLTDCYFHGNSATSAGGAVYSLGECIVERCTFLSNSVTATGGNSGHGGAIGTENRLFVYSSTFHGNSVLHETADSGGTGGAISHPFGGGGVWIFSSTITGNSSNVNSGGVFTGGTFGNFRNTVIAGNTAPLNPDFDNLGVNLQSCLIGTDPATVFETGSPANHGGTMPTIALKRGGPAIDSGDNALATDINLNPFVTDQRGVVRIVGGTVDIGAYEFVVRPTLATASASAVTHTGAILGGEVSDDGHGQVRRGFAFTRTSENPAPALGGTGVTEIEVAGTTGAFDTALDGLLPLTEYAFAAFAENEAGTAYSTVVTFRTTEAPSLLVTLGIDTVNPDDGQISLREALAYAQTLGGAQTITFAPSLAGQTITLSAGWAGPTDSSSLRVTSTVVIQGLTTEPGVTLAVAPGVQRRHFQVGTGGHLTLLDLTLTGGNVADLGGSVWNQFGSLIIRRCTFSGNSSANEGGAVHCWGGTPLLEIENSTFVGNSAATVGSAIVTGAASNSFKHLTITGNTGPGVIWLFDTVPTIDNSIVAGNSPDGIAVAGSGAFAASSAGNVFGTGNTAGITHGANGNLTGLTATELRLGPLANNGGPTPTVAPLIGSPVINSGSAIGGITNDQRGSVRTVGAAPDTGAVEDATGDDDPDHDNLDNVTEALASTSPVLLDTDSDGFNDATEILNGSDPTLSGSVPGTTRIERVLGYGPARGLDLSGNFVHAFNVGTSGAAGQAGDAYFTADNAAGITVTATNEIASWTTRDFGSSSEDTTLETVFQTIRWDDTPNVITVTLGNLTPGNRYKLQLLFAEGGDYDRRFDVRVNGVLVADDFNVSEAQGIPVKTYAAAAIVHEFTATTTSAQIVLSGQDVATPAVDYNPILNGVTLEQIAVAAPIVQWRALHGLAADGTQDHGNPSGDGVANLLKYAFNMAPNAGDLLMPNRSILTPGGTTGLPAITVNGTPQLVIQFVRRKATTNPGITYQVETGDHPGSLDPIDLSGAVIESINTTWERVTVNDPATGPRRFGRVSIQRMGP
jgi:CSLREA domain-containing protein